MDCVFKYWKFKTASYAEIVEYYQVTPLPPPPPPPPETISFADYVTLVAKWEYGTFAPAVGSTGK